MGIQTEIVGLDRLKRLLKFTEKKVKDLSPTFKIIRAKVVASVRRNFVVGGRPDKWLDPVRKSDPKHKHQNRPTLRITSALMNATSGKVTKGPKGTDLEMRNNLRYARAQQFGTLAVGGHLPPRPFILFQDEDIRFASDQITEVLMETLRG